MTTATTAIARAIIATAREDAVVVLSNAMLTLRKVTAPEFTEAENAILMAIGGLVNAMNEAETKARGF